MKNSAVYTRGPIGRTMLKTAFAMLAGTLAMSGYNIVDTYFVGNLGKVPLAAMGFTFPIIMLIGCVFHGLGIGVMTTAAQAIGCGKKNKAAALVTSGVGLIVLISILLAIGGMSSARWIIGLLGASGEALTQAVGYMDIWFFGCVTAALSMSGNNLLIAAGDSRQASTFMVIGLAINAVLDPLLIFGYCGFPAMGIRGAALATVVAQAVATIGVLMILWKKHRLLEPRILPWREMRPAWNLMIRFAVPGTIGMLMMPLGSTIITWITARFGDTAVAATAAAGRLEMVAFVFPMALGISLMPMIGQNFGARLYSRIRICRRFSMNFAFWFLLGMAVISFFAAPWLVRIFSPDEEVRHWMVVCMRIVPWGFGMVEVHRFAGFFYTGCGRPAVAAWLNGFRIIGLTIPFSFVALYFGSLEGLFFARLAADVLAGGIGWWLARRMVNALPGDGEIPPVAPPAWLLVRKVLPFGLASVASAQADIDNRSATQ